MSASDSERKLLMKFKTVQKCLLASRTSFACRVVRMVIRRGDCDGDYMAVSKKYPSNHTLPHSCPFRHHLITSLVENSTVPGQSLSGSRSYVTRRHLLFSVRNVTVLNDYFLLRTSNC